MTAAERTIFWFMHGTTRVMWQTAEDDGSKSGKIYSNAEVSSEPPQHTNCRCAATTTLDGEDNELV